MVIWKFPVGSDCVVEMPTGATILSANVQHGNPCIWALVDPNQPVEQRRFKVIPTGKDFDGAGSTYIGSFHGVGGWMVFHLFEESTGSER
jgi:hypothetical protein